MASQEGEEAASKEEAVVTSGLAGASEASLAMEALGGRGDPLADVGASTEVAVAAAGTATETEAGARAARIVDGCRRTNPIAHTTTTDRRARCDRG